MNSPNVKWNLQLHDLEKQLTHTLLDLVVNFNSRLRPARRGDGRPRAEEESERGTN